MTIRIGYHTYSWVPWMHRTGNRMTLDEILQQVVQADFAAVEVADEVTDFPNAEALIAPLKRLKLTLTGLNGQYRGNPGDPDNVRQAADYLAATGSGVLVLFDGRRRVPHTPENIRQYAQLAETLARYAVGRGVKTAYHNHVGSVVESAEEVAQFLDQTQVCGLCLDLAHLMAAGDNPLPYIDEWRSRITHVHLKDCVIDETTNRLVEFCEMGQGNSGLDVGACVRALERVDYDGWMVVEQDQTRRTPLESARSNRAFLRKLGY